MTCLCSVCVGMPTALAIPWRVVGVGTQFGGTTKSRTQYLTSSVLYAKTQGRNLPCIQLGIGSYLLVQTYLMELDRMYLLLVSGDLFVGHSLMSGFLTHSPKQIGPWKYLRCIYITKRRSKPIVRRPNPNILGDLDISVVWVFMIDSSSMDP